MKCAALVASLVFGLAAQDGTSAAVDSLSELQALTVDGVQSQLEEWGLSQAFGSEFREAEIDGETLAMLSGRNFKKLDRSRYERAQFFHFDKLEKRLNELISNDPNDGADEAVPRRQLAALKNYAGLNIASNNSRIQMGTTGDVSLTRTGNEELTIDAKAIVEGSVVVGGNLKVDGVNSSVTMELDDYTAKVRGSYDVKSKDFTYNGYSVSRGLWVRVLSVGYDDPGYGCEWNGAKCAGPNTRSAMWVNGETIYNPSISNTAYRGHNFAVINQVTGEVEDVQYFDSHGVSTSDDEIKWYIGNITEGRIVMLALHDAAGNYEHPNSILSLVPGHEFDADFELRESFCLIGRKGKVATSWMTRYFSERFEGPSWCEAMIPLMPESIESTYEHFETEGETVRRVLADEADIKVDTEVETNADTDAL